MIKNRRIIIQDIRKGKHVIFTKDMADDIGICAELIKLSSTYYPLFSTEIKTNKRILLLLSTKRDCWLQLPYIPKHCITMELLKSFINGDTKGFFDYFKSIDTRDNQNQELIFYALEHIHKEENYFYIKENPWITTFLNDMPKRNLSKLLTMYPGAIVSIASLPYEISRNYIKSSDVLKELYKNMKTIVWIDKGWHSVFTKEDYYNLLLVHPEGYDFVPTCVKRRININSIKKIHNDERKRPT